MGRSVQGADVLRGVPGSDLGSGAAAGVSVAEDLAAADPGRLESEVATVGDMTEHVTVTCSTNEEWTLMVKGRTGDYVVRWGRLPPDAQTQYGYTCTCPAFKFGRGSMCKHIRAADPQRCGWNGDLELVDVKSLSTDHEGNPLCPECGAQVRYVKVAV